MGNKRLPIHGCQENHEFPTKMVMFRIIDGSIRAPQLDSNDPGNLKLQNLRPIGTQRHVSRRSRIVAPVVELHSTDPAAVTQVADVWVFRGIRILICLEGFHSFQRNRDTLSQRQRYPNTMAKHPKVDNELRHLELGRLLRLTK